MATRTPPSGPPAPPSVAGGRAPRRAPAVRVGPPPRERRPALLVGAVLLIVVSAAIITSLFLQVGNRTEVLAVARTVPIGRPIAVEDLKRVRIATDPGLHTIPVSAADQVIGKPAATTLLPGTLLTPEQLGASQLPAAGQAIVGLDLKGAQMPVPADQLQPGAKVRIIATPAPAGTPSPRLDAQGAVLVDQAQVFSVQAVETSDTIHVAVVVADRQARRVLRAAASGQAGLVVLPASASPSEGAASP
jgi:SAF domain